MNDFFLELSARATNFTPASVENVVFFDETNGQVISVTNGTKISIRTKRDGKERNYELKSAGPVFAIKCSLSNEFLSVQRSQLSIDVFFQNNKDGVRDVVLTPSSKAQIHSFFWLKDNKLCVLTKKNIEIFQILKDSVKAKPVAKVDVSVYWCKYSFLTNTIVINSSPAENTLHLFNFDNSQLLRLPKIEVPKGISIKEKTVWLFKLYGNNYICHLFCVNNEDRLILYDITKSSKTFIEEAFFILGTSGESYAVNIIDNLVLVHNMNSKNTTLFDIRSVPSERSPSISGSNQSINGYGSVINNYPIKSDTTRTSNDLNLYISQMSFFQPNLVIDHQNGKLWELELCLDKLSNLFPNEELSLRFLMRRTFNKSVIFNLFRKAIAGDQKVPCERLARLFDQLAANMINKKSVDVVIDQNEIALLIFQPLLVEKLVSYQRLSEIILLSMRSFVNQNIITCDMLIALLISSLIKSDQVILIEQLIINAAIPISPAVACSLLSNQATLQLGLEMLKKGGGNQSQISEVLLANDELLEALRYCPIHQQSDVNFTSKKYLDKALQLNDQLFKIVFKYFKDVNRRATTQNKQPPLPMPSKYYDIYIDKFGLEDLKMLDYLMTIKSV